MIGIILLNIRFQDEVSWNKFKYNDNLSKSLKKKCLRNMDINKIQNYIEWEKYYSNKFDWNNYKFYQNNQLSEDFIREFQDKVNWEYISWRQKLLEDFIKEFKNKVNWDLISQYQILSEDFIKKFQNKVNWIKISIHQKLSEDFIKEFQDKIDWHWFKINKKLSEKFKEEMFNKYGY